MSKQNDGSAKGESQFITILSRVATVVAVCMYVSYIPQLQANLAGNGVDGMAAWLQPLVAGINCTLWVIYALYKRERDIPVALANAPGIFFGFATAITALIQF